MEQEKKTQVDTEVQSKGNNKIPFSTFTPNLQKEFNISSNTSNREYVFRPWMLIVTVFLLMCIIFITYGASSIALYNKIPDGSTECKDVFDVKTQNTLISIGCLGSVIFGYAFYKNYKICNK
jgi:hypothetical protein